MNSKNKTENVRKKQILLSACIRIQGQEKQKIHFTNANQRRI